MYKLKYAEFYITNVCNLNCTNCNRFNNFAFTGHQRWGDYADTYAQWAKVLDVDEFGILGGEPLLNPDFPQWLDGIASLWPNSRLKITTNGTQFKRWPDLYDQLLKYKDRIKLDVSLHNSDFKEEIIDCLNQWIVEPVSKTFRKSWNSDELWVTSYKQIADPRWPNCPTPEDFINLPKYIQDECHNIHGVSLDYWQQKIYTARVVDANGLVIDLNPAWYFNESTVVHNLATNQLSLNHSDPNEAVEICYSKQCHHFIRGKLYKCGPVGILPEFIQQFPVEISDEDRNLINNYTPAEVSWSEKQMTEFIAELKQYKSIPQCTFCPSKMQPREFKAGTKKIKIVKL